MNRAIACSLCLTFAAAHFAAGQDSPGSATGVQASDLRALVAALGDSSFDKRTAANRQLLTVGWPARTALQAAVEDADVEVAMRSRQILSVFDQLHFLGAEVRLEFSKTTTAWNEPIELTVTVTNRTPYPLRVPFEVGPTAREAITGDARQVADVLDVSEWLTVRNPAGEAVELRIDDIAADPTVSEVVSERAKHDSGAVLPAGETVSLVLTQFNRGWTRYPLLEAGEYRTVLDYTPQWSDPALAAVRAGRVQSNVAVITIPDPAPPTVGRGGPEVEVVVEREGDAFIARIVNHSDLAVQVNMNLGAALPFAAARWVLDTDGGQREIGVSPASPTSWKAFTAERIATVAAGESLEIARLTEADIRKALAEPARGPRGDRGHVSLSYNNMCDRQWQFRQGPAFLKDESIPAVLREPLPRRLLNVRLTSNRVAVPSE